MPERKTEPPSQTFADLTRASRFLRRKIRIRTGNSRFRPSKADYGQQSQLRRRGGRSRLRTTCVLPKLPPPAKTVHGCVSVLMSWKQRNSTTTRRLLVAVYFNSVNSMRLRASKRVGYEIQVIIRINNFKCRFWVGSAPIFWSFWLCVG